MDTCINSQWVTELYVTKRGRGPREHVHLHQQSEKLREQRDYSMVNSLMKSVGEARKVSVGLLLLAVHSAVQPSSLV